MIVCVWWHILCNMLNITVLVIVVVAKDCWSRILFLLWRQRWIWQAVLSLWKGFLKFRVTTIIPKSKAQCMLCLLSWLSVRSLGSIQRWKWEWNFLLLKSKRNYLTMPKMSLWKLELSLRLSKTIGNNPWMVNSASRMACSKYQVAKMCTYV